MRWSDTAHADPVLIAGLVVAAGVLSMLGSVWAIRHARRNDLIDQPGERRSHAVPTPRGGGIGIVVACLGALHVLARNRPDAAPWLLVAAGLAMVAAIGWWDDHRPLPPWPRLAVHAVAAACLATALHLLGAGLPVVVAAFVLALVLVNAWNFMDGIDGLAASQALLCAAAFALLPGLAAGAVWLALALTAGCAGFLPFNAPRARIFLGDVGSGGLGYLVATLLGFALAARPQSDWPLLLLAPGAMLVDAGATLLKRVARGERWWQPHVGHLYQRLGRRHGHITVVTRYGLWTIMAATVMLFLAGAGRGAIVAAVAWLGCSLLAWVGLGLASRSGNTEGFGK
jgi:UDP-N-acetylmuramyl pentapeptide phosphotransferase/UDP-N-acetylglucosamine-1-phosphate transferase